MKKLLALFLSVVAISLCAQEFKNFVEVAKAGQEAQNKGDYNAMIKIYSSWKAKAKTAYQKFACYHSEAYALRMLKKFDESLKLYDEYLAGNPEEPYKSKAILIKAYTSSGKADFDSAIKFYAEALSTGKLSKSDTSNAAIGLVRLYFYKKEYQKSIDIGTKYADIFTLSSRGEMLCIVGESYLKLEKTAEAEKMLLESMKISKNKVVLARANYLYGNQMLKQDKEEDAVKHFKSAVEAAPKSWYGKYAAKRLEELE